LLPLRATAGAKIETSVLRVCGRYAANGMGRLRSVAIAGGPDPDFDDAVRVTHHAASTAVDLVVHYRQAFPEKNSRPRCLKRLDRLRRPRTAAAAGVGRQVISAGNADGSDNVGSSQRCHP